MKRKTQNFPDVILFRNEKTKTIEYIHEKKLENRVIKPSVHESVAFDLLQ